MPNTYTTNFNLTKPENGGSNDTWGELLNADIDDLDTQLFRKADKNDQKGATHTLTFASGSSLVTTNVTRGFASFAVGDKIDISHSGNAANKGEFKVEGITNDITLDLETLADAEPSFATESVSSVVSIMPEITKVIGSLDVSADTLTTSTAQKDAIVDGSTAISRSGNNLTFAGDVVATSNSSAATASIGSSSPNASAILDLTSTTKAFLLPRMTGTQMNAISSPTVGMMIFNTSEDEGDGALFVYIGSTWRQMAPA